jgi:hypothetical protein
MKKIRIVDNKKIDMTQDEWQMFENICSAHQPYGKDLFKGLFETDEEGIIVYLVPPAKKFSLEVIIFLQNLMLHQHLRKIYKEHDDAMKEIKQALEELKK